MTITTWEDRAARFLKAELKRAGVTYDDLAERLKAHGMAETEGLNSEQAIARDLRGHVHAGRTHGNRLRGDSTRRPVGPRYGLGMKDWLPQTTARKVAAILGVALLTFAVCRPARL